MLSLASLTTQFPSGVGAAAASMAVFAFLFQALPALRRSGEHELRQMAAFGGLVGLSIAFIVIVLGATFKL